MNDGHDIFDGCVMLIAFIILAVVLWFTIQSADAWTRAVADCIRNVCS